MDLSFDAARHVSARPRRSAAPTSRCKVHARYQREEILAALDFPRNPNSFREGVWYSAEHNVDAFFVTLKKSEADYSPTTMYRDYPISPNAVPLGVPVHDVGRVHRLASATCPGQAQS